MKIEVMIYIYIAICISMIVYNIIYVFVLRHKKAAISSASEKIRELLKIQLENVKNGEEVDGKHIKFLRRELDKTMGVMAFDAALDIVSKEEPESLKKYLVQVYPAFEYLTQRYMEKDTLKTAYFPYILYKYEILNHYESESLIDELFTLLRSANVYCRENTLKAIYSMRNPEYVVMALKIIDTNLSFHHPKLISDGLFSYKGDTEELKNMLFAEFDEYSVQMRVNILNYFRFAGVRCDEEMLSILKEEKQNSEIHFAAIRYFEKFPIKEARVLILEFAENLEGRIWEYQAIASSALRSYPGDATFRVLVKNLSNRQWHVRQNSAISCVELGYTYQDLISVFDGRDRYAREIMRYWLDRQEAEEEVPV